MGFHKPKAICFVLLFDVLSFWLRMQEERERVKLLWPEKDSCELIDLDSPPPPKVRKAKSIDEVVTLPMVVNTQAFEHALEEALPTPCPKAGDAPDASAEKTTLVVTRSHQLHLKAGKTASQAKEAVERVTQKRATTDEVEEETKDEEEGQEEEKPVKARRRLRRAEVTEEDEEMLVKARAKRAEDEENEVEDEEKPVKARAKRAQGNEDEEKPVKARAKRAQEENEVEDEEKPVKARARRAQRNEDEEKPVKARAKRAQGNEVEDEEKPVKARAKRALGNEVEDEEKPVKARAKRAQGNEVEDEKKPVKARAKRAQEEECEEDVKDKRKGRGRPSAKTKPKSKAKSKARGKPDESRKDVEETKKRVAVPGFPLTFARRYRPESESSAAHWEAKVKSFLLYVLPKIEKKQKTQFEAWLILTYSLHVHQLCLFHGLHCR